MRTIALFFVVLASGCPGPGVTGGVPPSYNPACAPVEAVTPTSIAIGHADGRPYAIGDTFDVSRGGQGLTMAHFTVLVGGAAVPSCVEAEVHVNYAVNHDAHAVTPDADGGALEYYMGPISGNVTVTATVGGMTATLAAGSTVYAIE